jgi:hypothetical protein
MQNCAVNGVFILTDASPPVGSAVQFRVKIDGVKAIIRARAQVNRIVTNESESADVQSGFAASTRRMTLHKLADSIARSS